eukprot:4701964-Ditylum_brightwellii.AAC.1
MGIKIAPNEAQAIIEEILCGLDVEAYINNVGIFTKVSFKEHLEFVDKVLQRLQDNNMKVNPLKCKWGVQETNFLGHWITPEGVWPWKKKVEMVMRMSPPSNMTELHSFIGAVTYYKNIWPHRSHILAPLTNLTGKGQFKCEQAHQK